MSAYWTHRLTAIEQQDVLDRFVHRQEEGREHESWVEDAIESAQLQRQRQATPRLRELWFPAWAPMLPREVNRCALCGVPSSAGMCRGCADLRHAYGWPFASVQFLCATTRAEEPGRTFWAMKAALDIDVYRRDRYTGAIHSDASPALIAEAAALSAYLELAQPSLLGEDPVVTAIPSRLPLLSAALALASEMGWFSVPVVQVGEKTSYWSQHLQVGKGARLERSPGDWTIDRELVAGRPVLLMDDVWTTGASMATFAIALRRAGATEVRALAIARQRLKHDRDYLDALRLIRGEREWHWSPMLTHRCQPDVVLRTQTNHAVSRTSRELYDDFIKLDWQDVFRHEVYVKLNNGSRYVPSDGRPGVSLLRRDLNAWDEAIRLWTDSSPKVTGTTYDRVVDQAGIKYTWEWAVIDPARPWAQDVPAKVRARIAAGLRRRDAAERRRLAEDDLATGNAARSRRASELRAPRDRQVPSGM